MKTRMHTHTYTIFYGTELVRTVFSQHMHESFCETPRALCARNTDIAVRACIYAHLGRGVVEVGGLAGPTRPRRTAQAVQVLHLIVMDQQIAGTT